MADTNNPFEKLIVDDSQEANKEELANLIGPYVYFIRSNHAVEFKPEIRDLPNKLKILIVLASFKAKSYIFDTDEKLSQKEIISLDLMPAGSVKATLKELFDAGEIKSDNQKYYLPGYRISLLASSIKNYRPKVKVKE